MFAVQHFAPKQHDSAAWQVQYRPKPCYLSRQPLDKNPKLLIILKNILLAQIMEYLLCIKQNTEEKLDE